MLDERGELVLEQKVSTTPKAMEEVFGGMPRSRIALETGTHSPWVSRLLSELGHEVIVAHEGATRVKWTIFLFAPAVQFFGAPLAALPWGSTKLVSPNFNC